MVSEVESIPQYLKAFKPIGLVELDKVALLDRMDTKYVFTIEQLPMFLDRLKDTYCVLEINNNSMFHYESLYFDTDAFYLFNQHFCGRLNRYKVRFRKYVESNQSFFEIKFKNNKSRTVKSRIKQLLSQEIEGGALNLLETKSPLSQSGLKAKFWVNYVRITLVSNDFKERLTLDLDLTFKNEIEEKTISNLVIAELKQSKAGNSSFSKLMKEFHIRSGSISKYCFGVVSLFKKVRMNNFKSQIQQINKILNASPTRS